MIALWKLPKKERKDFEQRYAQLTKKNVLLNEKVNYHRNNLSFLDHQIALNRNEINKIATEHGLPILPS